MEKFDTYKTIEQVAEGAIYKEKGSKFLGYAYPMVSETQLNEYLLPLKKNHHKARHFCYAYQIGKQQLSYRVNDDGEPSGTAGQPIYGQIQSYGLTDILIIVVRYFGGTKLGTGGLTQAYKESARLALEACTIVEKTINNRIELVFDYKDLSSIMHIIKDWEITVEEQQLQERCRMTVGVRKSKTSELLKVLEPLYEIQVKQLD